MMMTMMMMMMMMMNKKKCSQEISIWVISTICMLTFRKNYSKMAATLVFFCFLANYYEPLVPRFRENILLNFEFKNEATRANLQENKRILKWQPFWNKGVSF